MTKCFRNALLSLSRSSLWSATLAVLCVVFAARCAAQTELAHISGRVTDESGAVVADTGWVDGNTGALRQVFLPSGQHSGNTIGTWLWGLHYGDIRDFLSYRILVELFGLILTGLSATGVYIWWK